MFPISHVWLANSRSRCDFSLESPASIQGWPANTLKTDSQTKIDTKTRSKISLRQDTKKRSAHTQKRVYHVSICCFVSHLFWSSPPLRPSPSSIHLSFSLLTGTVCVCLATTSECRVMAIACKEERVRTRKKERVRLCAGVSSVRACVCTCLISGVFLFLLPMYILFSRRIYIHVNMYTYIHSQRPLSWTYGCCASLIINWYVNTWT